MPKHGEEPQFLHDYWKLSSEDRLRFRVAVQKMVTALNTNSAFPSGLHIQQMSGHSGVYEMRWSDRGRATFHYGTQVDGNIRLFGDESAAMRFMMRLKSSIQPYLYTHHLIEHI